MKAALLTTLLFAVPAFADAAITVDGNASDWTASATCFSEAAGDGTGTIDLTRACIENNNSSGDLGRVFMLFQNVGTNILGTEFGWQYDKNQDGVINASDEVWYVEVPPSGSGPFAAIVIIDPTTWAERRRYTDPANCGGTGTSNGWSAAFSGSVVELSISYGCLGWSANDDNRLVQMGAYPALDTAPPGWYDGSRSTITAVGAPPNVLQFTVSSGPGRNTLTWSNPSAHQGVVVLRRVGSQVQNTPANGTEYTLGQRLGGGQIRDEVVYVDGNVGGAISSVSTFTDTAVLEPTAGGAVTRYHYKVFNHHQARTYAPGNVPTSAGLFGEPTKVVRPTGWNGPLWCYTTGLASYVQPTQRRDIGVYAPGNLPAVAANNTTRTAQATDGLERFRPQSVTGALTDRFTVATSGGFNGIFTGDQSGRLYAFNADTGALAWGSGAPLSGASSIQSTPVFQARAFSSPAFQSAFSSDLLFVATRNSNPTTNRIYAVRSDNGQVVWTGPKNPATGALVPMDMVSGAPWVEYDATGINRVWLGSGSNGGSQPALWVLDSMTGNVLKTFSLPAGVDLPVFKDNTLKQMLVVDNAGTVRGYDLATLTEAWNVSIGGLPASFPYAVGGGFFISRKRTSGTETGRVYRYKVVNNVPTISTGWPRSVPDPSFPSIDFTPGAQRVYVGSSDGQIHSMDIDNGSFKPLRVSTLQVGTPGVDPTAARIHVYGAEGRLCAFQLPIN